MAGFIIVKKDVSPMKFGLMFSDISRALFRRPATENYPTVRQRNPPRLRSFLEWNQQACTGCGLCAMDCPAKAIHVTILDRKAKRFVFSYRPDLCIFCGQCVETCRQGSLSMANDQWELAALDKKPFFVNFGDVDDITKVLAGSFADGPQTPEKA
jgi:formate hydrogenlyase subunit 6/NADH:ubiquinone oxidoreductase subunit I